MIRRTTFLILAMFAATLSAATLQPTDKSVEPGKPAQPTFQGDGYYLGICAQCRQPLGLGDKGDTVHALYEKREVLFCESKCRDEFDKDQSASLARLDELLIRDQLPLYPLDTSIITKKPLGEKPVSFIWYNRLVRVVDADEKAAFLKDPAKYLGALNEAVMSKQRPSYSITKCVVQGDQLDDDAEETVVANRLVRVCCKSCAKRIRANPRMYLQMIDYARQHASDTLPAK